VEGYNFFDIDAINQGTCTPGSQKWKMKNEIDSVKAFRYAVAYKAYNTMCVYRDRLQRPSLGTMGVPQDLHPAGRLDLDSEGLLLLTNDGQTQHRIEHPDFSHFKTYLVLVLGHLSTGALTQLRDGVALSDGDKTQPADVEELSSSPSLPVFPGQLPAPQKTSWLRMVLYEGKNRQIKRMTAAVGHPAVRLVRVAVGPLTLPIDLKPGEWRDLNLMERRILLDWVWHGGL
jgi:23S rRNA pseudouridine2457 synthase